MSDYLPEKAIVKILKHLPVKSLLQFKCVCKRWRSLISNPLFAKSHYKQKPPSHRLLVSTDIRPSEFDSLPLEEEEEGSSLRFRGLVCPLYITEFDSPLGSCNGMICLTQITGFGTRPCIWNPSTGKKLKLLAPGVFDVVVCGGFGYLSATDDYKIVVGSSAGKDHLVWDVFSLRAWGWKRVQSPPGHVLFPEDHLTRKVGLLFNEALHWLSYPRQGIVLNIMALDLATLKFRIMPLPHVIMKRPNDDVNLCVSGGFLCLLLWNQVTAERSEHGHVYTAEFWIMKEYGKSDSWTMLHNFSLSNQLPDIHRVKPILIKEASSVVAKMIDGDGFESADGFELVRIEHGQGKHVDIKRYRTRFGDNDYNMIVCEESLLWLPDCHGVKKKSKRLKSEHRASGSRNAED